VFVTAVVLASCLANGAYLWKIVKVEGITWNVKIKMPPHKCLIL
jgi:xanthine/uracil/vitamin C permease (AzgA family)